MIIAIAVIIIIAVVIAAISFACCKVSGDCSRYEEMQDAKSDTF